MAIKVKKIEHTQNFKNKNESKKISSQGERNVRCNDRILSKTRQRQ